MNPSTEKAEGMVGTLLFSWRSLREIFSGNQFFVPQRSTKEAQKTQNVAGFAKNLNNEIYVTNFSELTSQVDHQNRVM